MKVLITGGAGYIGSHLTDYFHANGDTVTVVVISGHTLQIIFMLMVILSPWLIISPREI